MNNIIILIFLIIIGSIVAVGLGVILHFMNVILNKIFKKNLKLKFTNASIYSEDRINQDLVRQEVIDRARYTRKF